MPQPELLSASVVCASLVALHPPAAFSGLRIFALCVPPRPLRVPAPPRRYFSSMVITVIALIVLEGLQNLEQI